MKNYKQTAADVLRLVGGDKNVSHLEHCSTRLRFTLADPAKADAAALKKTPGVMGVIASGPQCQVVIGNDVIEVYDELMKMGSFNAAAGAAPAPGKKNIGGLILDYMVGIFQPLVPAIAGAGVLAVVVADAVAVGIHIVTGAVAAGIANAVAADDEQGFCCILHRGFDAPRRAERRFFTKAMKLHAVFGARFKIGFNAFGQIGKR